MPTQQVVRANINIICDHLLKVLAKKVCLIKDRNLSNTLKECPRFEVTNHPLRANLVSMVHTNSKSVEEVDPLSVIEGGDPLSTFVQESLVTEAWKPFAEDVTAERDDDGVKAWNSRRTSILNKYTTVEKLSIISSFLPGGEKMMIKQSSNVSEQVKHRLEQLDQFEEGSVRKTMGLTQQEYTSRISLLNNELVQAWNSEQRVKALKIAIQCSKMLVDTSVMQFYPSKFVLVTDILETFGNLVYERLKGKSYERADIPKYLSDVDPDQVPESAKETCQNWLYKMASIRELVPRLYIEMSLLRCYIFLSRNEFDSAIERLTRMIRGVGHPLVALYARCYLCRVALTVITRSRGYFKSNLQEFLQTYTQIFEPSVKRDYKSQALNIDTYLSLYTPPLDWLLYGVMTYGKSIDVFLDELLTESENLQKRELLLYCVISSFDSYKISNKAAKILELIASSESTVLRQEMVLLVGERVCGAAGAGGGAAGEALVQAAWKLLHALPALPHFLRALEPWMHFACVHLSPKHINILLRGILKYITKSDDSIADYSHLLQAIIKRMLANIEDVEELFLMDGFMPLLDIIQAAAAQIEMSKAILNSFVSRDSCLVISDYIVIGTVMRLCRVLHDSINALTVEDEQKLTSELISKFVQSVSYHDDYEQQLAFYVDCRSAFINLDPVLVTLVHCVNRLAVSAGGGGGGGTRLVRACAAYCFITVPSLPCPLLKAQLYLLTAQVALLNACLGQAEACMKLSISILPEIPEKHLEDGQMKSTQIKVHSLLSNFLSTLLVMPDNVEANCKLYLLKGVLKAIELLPWERTDSLFYLVLLDVLDLLCNLAQETYSYHIESVVSNDLLYGSDKEFINEVDRLSTAVSEELLTILKRLGDERQFKKQLNLSLELFWRVVRRGDLETPQMETLAANLWLLSKKHQDQDVKLAKNLITTLKKENEKTKMYVNLLAKIKG